MGGIRFLELRISSLILVWIVVDRGVASLRRLGDIAINQMPIAPNILGLATPLIAGLKELEQKQACFHPGSSTESGDSCTALINCIFLIHPSNQRFGEIS